MIKWIIVVLVAAAATIVGMALNKPDAFHYERKATMKAPPEKIFAILNDLHKGALWSPFEKLDPAMKKSFSGADTGVGAVYAWDGNGKAGAGRMEIVEADAPRKLLLRLEFSRPFRAVNTVAFTLEPQGTETAVTWAMYGPNNFAAKVMSVFINCEKMIGKDFETGLANLKTLVERQ